jgi:hypothetical protein
MDREEAIGKIAEQIAELIHDAALFCKSGDQVFPGEIDRLKSKARGLILWSYELGLTGNPAVMTRNEAWQDGFEAGKAFQEGGVEALVKQARDQPGRAVRIGILDGPPPDIRISPNVPVDHNQESADRASAHDGIDTE